MSVQVNTYVLVGTRLKYETGQFERYEKWTDSAFKPKQAGLVCLYDGMCGEYIFLGWVIAVTENHRHFYEPIRVKASKELRETVKEDLIKTCGLTNPKVGVWIVSHHR